MPIHYEIEDVKAEVYNGFTCDRCGSRFDRTDRGAKERSGILYYRTNSGKPKEATFCGDCTFIILTPYTN